MNASKRDANHATIRDLIRAIPGVWVKDTGGYAGLGCDLIARYQDNAPVFMEIKDGPKKALTDSEKQLKTRLAGYWFRIETFEDALRALGISTEAAPF